MVKGMKFAHAALLFITLFWSAEGQSSSNGAIGFSLNPPYFNLAEGARISATATCGQDETGRPRQDLYCKLVGGPTTALLSQNIQGQFCDYCNANDPNKAHPASNAIDGTERWWQSPPLSRGLIYNEVNVTLDLGQLFHVAYVLIKFANSPRPDLWVLEHSVDGGRTYSPWQYFAHSKRECIERFGKQPNGRITRDDDQICTTEYSRIVPLENGEIVVSLINGRPGAQNFTYSPVLRDFTKATNIRLHFLQTSTLLGHLISKAQRDPTVTRRYYYSIKDISIGGRCVCHGHAAVCDGNRYEQNPNRLQCQCEHNTCGESCDRCCPGFNQKPWRAATVHSPNECQPCQCFSHAFDCYYDPDVEKRGASLDNFGRYDGGGVCIECQHNTAGVNCERCIDGFYRPHGVPPESHTGCIPCRCDERTTAGCEMGSGRCLCKPQFTGENCDRCADGYYNYPQCIKYPVYQTTTKSPAGPTVDPTCPPGYYGPPRCQQCVCDYRGTVQEVCDAFGRCLCRPGVEGEGCDRCQPGYSSFPNCQVATCPPGYYGPPRCQQCVCDYRGTVQEVCGPVGRCLCRPGVEGERCDRCQPGYSSFPNCQVATCPPGYYGPPRCQQCVCDYRGTVQEVCGPVGRCLCRPGVEGERCDRCQPGYSSFPNCQVATCPPGYYGPPRCQQCVCDYRGTVQEVCGPVGRCLCRPGVEGERCDRCQPGYSSFPNCQVATCAPGYYGPPRCQKCVCDYRGTVQEVCDAFGRCLCRPGVEGERCDRCQPGYSSFPNCQVATCPPGYYGPPRCQQCVCDYRGTVQEVCDAFGRCLCRPGVEGEGCDRCQPGYSSFPNCQACDCDGVGAADIGCASIGLCLCLPNYVGQNCDECAPGFYGYPDCAACQCSAEGSYGSTCNSLSGQCLCLPGVVGQQCDRCASGGLRFPQCSASIGICNSAGSEMTDPQAGLCRCRPNVEGTLCDKCKPLYWNLASNHPRGCIECRCDVKGTISGVGECDQRTGQCRCKPNTCGHGCDTCKDGYFLLRKRSYFGCQGCGCDVGGAIDSACDDISGQCQCRQNIIGLKCTAPTPNYYLPTLHHLKFELEDGTTPNARAVRFGYDPEAFPDYSWRGYAFMSPAQNEVKVSVHVDPQDESQQFFRVVLRFINPSSSTVAGHIRATNTGGTAGSEQSKEVVFPRSRSPSFLTVPGEGFAEPFALTPGKWFIHIRAEGVLLDYLVLLPRDYYEAPLLKEKVTTPCTYQLTADRDTNCLLYKHLSLDSFTSVLGSKGVLSSRSGRKKRQTKVRRPTADHPEMALLNGRQSQLQLTLRVPQPGAFVLVLEYASEVDTMQNVNMLISGQSGSQILARANIYSCTYSFLCRSVVVDSSNRVAMLQLTHKTGLMLQTSTTMFMLYKVYVVPAEEFSMEYVKPKVLCVSTHGRFTEDSRYCIQSQFELPTSPLLLSAARDGQLSSTPASALQPRESEEWRRRRQTSTFSVREPPSDAVLLKFPQTKITFSPRMPLPGRYVVVVHYHQPEHISFPVEVQAEVEREWTGSINTSFCPAVSGCREVVIFDGQIALDFTPHSWRQPSISLIIPPRKTLFVVYMLLVPDSSYTPDVLKAKPQDKSADFIQQCRGEGFFIDPVTSSQFCKDSALSLAAAYNNGALPCDCDKTGSTSSACDPVGGQCPCRQFVIGRQCNKCSTGYFGFPYCRPCGCGRRLCDDVTGRCICPPQTVRPSCDACQNQTYSYHPLLGCEGCECSPTGINSNDDSDCDRTTGQCSCKPRIGGRQCDRCAAGYYGFPQCVRCDCEHGGVTSDVCDPDTGACLCKRNVVGVRCDSCRGGSIHFDPLNPVGCTSCFCFGATDQCESSTKRRGKFVEMRGWRLENPDQKDVPSVLNSASGTVVADIQELSPTVRVLHWVAPRSYLGNRVSSYGGFLTYQTKSFGIPSEGMTLIDRRPDVLLTGRGMTLIHVAPQLPNPDRIYHGRVQILEGNWRHAGNNKPVSRQELMMVLASLVGLRIRALYFTQTQRLSLGDVGLEEASDSGTGGAGNTVEKCSCPVQYSGDSCEKCAPGYFRDGSGQYLGQCLPCRCNGLATECEDGTGKCLNCQYNTAGDRCDSCKEGYYGNPSQRTCTVCPCPFSVSTNSFAVGCQEVSGGIKCMCKLGYTGDRCERCSPGFYGQPMVPGGSCRPCNCNGNGNSCDPRTGICKNTLEPGDTDTDNECKECDNCALTLLRDLEKLDNELQRIKELLRNASASSTSNERLKKLEKAIADTKILVDKYSTSVNNQKPRITLLEDDMNTLDDDIGLLRDKEKNTASAVEKAIVEIDKTHKRAKTLDADIKNILKKIKALLDQLNEMGTSGDRPSNENLTKLLEEAERMVKEMQKRDFTPQETAAEKEREEAKKLLDYIKANVSDRCDQNEATAKNLKEILNTFGDKLKDLETALKKAEDRVKQATSQNDLSAKELKDLQKRIEALKREKKTVLDQMDMAKNELQKTEDLAKILTDSKTEYEKLAAQLDGAKTDLTKKVNDLSKAAAQEGIVIKAEDHAKKLAKLAKELEDAVKNASDKAEVRDAKDAIGAYKNITEAIKAAEAAANEAKGAAENALTNVNNQKLTERAKDLKDTSQDLLADAKDAEKKNTANKDEIADLKDRLAEADKKKETLEKDLLDARNSLKDINRDDIAKMLEDAKAKAGAANNTATSTLDRLDDIRKELDKINISPVDPNSSGILNDVDQSVKNLLNAIPTLNDKMSEVENLTLDLTPLSNITENIKRIKDLIEQARDAANRIGIPMKFNGDGYVEMRAPKDLDDLRAYTALSLQLQRPSRGGDGSRRRRQARGTEDLFVMYLGSRDSSKNYIGMVLRENVLYGVYKLNGKEYEMRTGYITKSMADQATFDRAVLRRIYQDAELVLDKDVMSTTENMITSNSKGEEKKNLLDLSPDDVVFYVGGYPTSFTPPAPLNFPMYKGCIEFGSFNDRVISLYNFQTAHKVNPETPCKRQVPAPESDFFEGSGYGKLFISKPGTYIIVDITVMSRSENGLLFFIGTEEKYFAVTIEKGVVRLHSNALTGPPTYISTKIFPVKDWVDGVIVFTTKGSITVRLAGLTAVKANADYNLDDFTECYVGGVPQVIREMHNITAQPFKGCVKNLKLDKKFRPIDEAVGISKGCPKEAMDSRKAEVNLGSSLSADLTGFTLDADVTLSLGFRSTENQGLILQNKKLANGLNVALEGGYVTLSFNNRKWRSNKQYNDGQWHYLTVTRRAGIVVLFIDDEDEGQEQSGSVAIPDTNGALVLGKDTFKGCVTNLYTRRPGNLYNAEDLSEFTYNGDVLLDVCSAHSPAQLMLDRTANKEEVVVRVVNESALTCALPTTVPHAYRLGGPVSSLTYSLPLQVLQPRPHFSLDVKTRSHEGLLFFTGTRGGRAHLALYMSKGRIRLSVAKEKEIFNREKYNDGKWHSVMFSLEKKKFRLVVDGIRALDGLLTSAELTSMQQFMSPVYLGSVPEALHQQLKTKALPKHSVSGCIRNFKMNGASMTEPSANHGVGPCFEGQTQKGAYFSGKGAHVIINDTFVLGSSFELLFNIRPRSHSGLLLYVGEPSRYGGDTSHSLSVYMLRGEVVAKVTDGKGEFMVSVKPKSTLCDGMFHKISVIKRKNVVQLHVDTVDNYKIGPPLSITPLTKNPLYVGGIPELGRKHVLPVAASFVGCIDDMTINSEPVLFNRLSAVVGPVNLKECPAG